jgi:cardiolipin synthase C
MFMTIFIELTFAFFYLFNYDTSPTGRPGPTQAQSDTLAINTLLGLQPALMKNKTGACPLENGGNSFVTRAWLCQNAQKTLDIQYYIFSKDNTGLLACDFLVRAADRGVKVRLIVDDITVKAWSRAIYALDSHDNIEIRVYNPGVKLGNIFRRVGHLVTHLNKIHKRMHNKTFTVDDQVTIIGGRNIADEYFDFDHRYNFRDRDVMLLGKSVSEVKQSFELFWNHKLTVPYTRLSKRYKYQRLNPQRFEKLHQFAADEKNFPFSLREKISNYPNEFKTAEKNGQLLWLGNVSYVSDVPGKNADRKPQRSGVCTDSMIMLIRSAKTSIDLQSPYVITTDSGKALVRRLTDRGVKIRVLTNSLGSTDNYEAFSGYQRDRKGLLTTGIELYEFKPNAAVRYKLMIPEIQAALSYTPVYGMHSKTMIIDGHITVIGSFNADPRSANHNTECVAIIRDERFARLVSKYINEEFLPENAWRITPYYNADKEASTYKQIKAASRKVFPKDIL